MNSVRNGNPKDRDSPLLLAALIIPTTIVAMPIVMQPAFVQGMVDFRSVSEVRAGYIASSEVMGLMAGTIFFAFFAKLLDWRQIFAGSMALVIVANLVTIWNADPTILLITRALAGLGGGLVTAIGFTLLAETSRPGRSFGLLVAIVMGVSALGFAVLPNIFALGGYVAFLGLYSLLLLLALPLARYVPPHRAADPHAAALVQDLGSLLTGKNIMALVSVLAFFIGVGAAWTYMSLVARDAGIPDDKIAYALSVTQFCGIFGALVIAFFADRVSHLKLAIPVLAITALSIAALGYEQNFGAFLAINAVYQFGWNAGQPLLMAIIAKRQDTDSLMRFAIPLQFIGLGIAPGVAATILNLSKGYDLVISSATGAILISLVFIIPLIRGKSPART